MFQEVICDITRRMGSGMCVFLEERVGSMAQWDEVCISLMCNICEDDYLSVLYTRLSQLYT